MAPDDWVSGVLCRLRVEFPGLSVRLIEATVHRCLMTIELDPQRVVGRAAFLEQAARQALQHDCTTAVSIGA
jgi:hypothetical protein